MLGINTLIPSCCSLVRPFLCSVPRFPSPTEVTDYSCMIVTPKVVGASHYQMNNQSSRSHHSSRVHTRSHHSSRVHTCNQLMCGTLQSSSSRSCTRKELIRCNTFDNILHCNLCIRSEKSHHNYCSMHRGKMNICYPPLPYKDNKT